MTYRRDKYGKLYLSKDEAYKIRDEYSRHRDFWLYDMESNRELLQAALDELQNSSDGNNYTVEYQDSQNSCRLTIYCNPCNKYLASYDPFMSHDAGKAHKKSLQLVINQKDIERTTRQTLQFKPLNSNKNIFDHDSLEDDIDHTKRPVLGLQFVYKEQIHGPSNSHRFSCQLCRVNRVKENDMFHHLVENTNHNRRYMQCKYNKDMLSTDQYQRICERTELLEGKINYSIIDFTGQFITIQKITDGMSSICASPPPSPGEAPQRHRSLSPPPPLTTDQGCQADPDELERSRRLTQELVDIKTNQGDESLSNDNDATELMLQTLQTLNLKMHGYYGKMGKEQRQCVKYQNYLVQLNTLLNEMSS